MIKADYRVRAKLWLWKTSIFFDKKSGAYLLPVKATVRKREKLAIGSRVELRVQISV